MTDKQMIIDDVDVSKCNYFNNTDKSYCEECCSEFGCAICNDRPNCYYKQLARKEEECEELKEDREHWKSNFNGKVSAIEELLKQLDQLKAENEELKTMLKDLSYENQKFCYQIEEQTKQLEPFKDEYFKGLDNVVIAELAKKSIRITAENSKLEQTLTEIKKITKNMNNECFYSDFDCKDCDMKNGCTYQGEIKILQKISECEVENERN